MHPRQKRNAKLRALAVGATYTFPRGTSHATINTHIRGMISGYGIYLKQRAKTVTRIADKPRLRSSLFERTARKPYGAQGLI
jgi:hypothetical protein